MKDCSIECALATFILVANDIKMIWSAYRFLYQTWDVEQPCVSLCATLADYILKLYQYSL